MHSYGKCLTRELSSKEKEIERLVNKPKAVYELSRVGVAGLTSPIHHTLLEAMFWLEQSIILSNSFIGVGAQLASG